MRLEYPWWTAQATLHTGTVLFRFVEHIIVSSKGLKLGLNNLGVMTAFVGSTFREQSHEGNNVTLFRNPIPFHVQTRE